MPSVASPTLLIIGIVLLLVGIWLWRASSRMVIDMKGAALGAAWQSVRSRQMPSVPDEIKSRFDEVAGQQTHTGKAAKAASIGVKHYVGQLLGIISFVCLFGGLGLAAAGIWWK